MLVSIVIGLVVIVVLAFVAWRLWQHKKEGDQPSLLEPKPVEVVVSQSEKQLRKKQPIQKSYHARAADEPPDGNDGKRVRDIDYQHENQREEIMAVHSDRGDIIEPASKRQRQHGQGQGMGLPAHPLTSVGPQGVAANLSSDAAANPNAQDNAQAHPENTPVPSAELHNQAKSQPSMAPVPKAPGQ